MAQSFVIPSRIPWDHLRAKELEECVYWLLDSMGAKDLEWRVGGRGNGAADGGRDLSATFYIAGPDGEMTKEMWWLEVKGRTATLEASAVKEAVHTAGGAANLDTLVLVTNTTFSNPTRDWVRGWQSSHPRPIVRLWDQAVLERMVSRHPSVAVRLYPEALSGQGTLEVLRSEFWNAAYLTGGVTLRRLWRVRAELEIGPAALLALLSCEIASGAADARSWALLVDNNVLANALVHGIANATYLLVRTERAGHTFDSFTEAMARILLVLLDRVSAATIARIIEQAWNDDARFLEAPAAVRRISVDAMVDRLETQLRDVCTSDCRRIITDPLRLSKEAVAGYWKRLMPPSDEDEESLPSKVLTIECHAEACNVGFPLDETVTCQFNRDDEKPLEARLIWLQAVIAARNPFHRSSAE